MSRVLIVDDDDALRSGWRTVLEARGHTVDEAANGRVGLVKLDTFDPDLVLLDARMPEVGATEFIAQTVDRTGLPPIVVVSAHDYERAAFPGAADVVLKPHEVDELVTLVDKMLAIGVRVKPKSVVLKSAVASGVREGSTNGLACLAASCCFIVMAWMVHDVLSVGYARGLASRPAVRVAPPQPEPLTPSREILPDPVWIADGRGEWDRKTDDWSSRLKEMERHARLHR